MPDEVYLGGYRVAVTAVDGTVLVDPATHGREPGRCTPAATAAICANGGGVADDKGGRDIVVAIDERSVWVASVRPRVGGTPQSLVRLGLKDGMSDASARCLRQISTQDGWLGRLELRLNSFSRLS